MILSFISKKGGFSRTASTVHVASYLARQSDLVILSTPPSTLGLGAVLETADILRRGSFLPEVELQRIMH